MLTVKHVNKRLPPARLAVLTSGSNALGVADAVGPPFAGGGGTSAGRLEPAAAGGVVNGVVAAGPAGGGLPNGNATPPGAAELGDAGLGETDCPAGGPPAPAAGGTFGTPACSKGSA